MAKRKPKITPVVISSRESAIAIVSALVEKKLALAARRVDIETETESIRKVYQPEIDDLLSFILAAEAGLQIWCRQNPGEFPPKQKSIDLPQARFGFRTGSPRCDKSRSRDTWDDLAVLLASVKVPATNDDGSPKLLPDGTPDLLFDGENYIRYGKAEIDKDALLRDRDIIPAEALKLAGIHIAQEEFWFFDPKSDVIDATSVPA